MQNQYSYQTGEKQPPSDGKLERHNPFRKLKYKAKFCLLPSSFYFFSFPVCLFGFCCCCVFVKQFLWCFCLTFLPFHCHLSNSVILNKCIGLLSWMWDLYLLNNTQKKNMFEADGLKKKKISIYSKGHMALITRMRFWPILPHMRTPPAFSCCRCAYLVH